MEHVLCYLVYATWLKTNLSTQNVQTHKIYSLEGSFAITFSTLPCWNPIYNTSLDGYLISAPKMEISLTCKSTLF